MLILPMSIQEILNFHEKKEMLGIIISITEIKIQIPSYLKRLVHVFTQFTEKLFVAQHSVIYTFFKHHCPDSCRLFIIC